jgi:hypothetical protein
MIETLAAPSGADAFIRRWEASGAAERANYALFLSELCDLLSGPRPEPTWPARARRVRPPAPHKDWTEAKAAGVDLRRWWGDIFAGIERPALFAWDELACWRW